jgi:glycosyltransferase involved in cell wall biosynthesis
MLVHGYYPRDIRVRREAEALTEAGFRVHVICLRSPGKSGRFLEPSCERINGVDVYRLPIARRRGTPVRYLLEYVSLIIVGAWKLILIHLKSPFLAVHIHNMPDALILAGLIPKWMGARLVLDVHDPMFEIYMQTKNDYRRHILKKALHWQERWSRRFADRIITVNEPMRKNIQDKGIPSNRIFVVHNFPDTLYLPVKDNIASWTRHKDHMVWLYAGTITKQYRLDVAVQALAIASPYLPPTTLRLLGEGNDLRRVLRLADGLGVRHRIECLEPVNIDQLGEFMKDADIGISCQQGGLFGDLQFSAKVIDYLSQGLPVVASRTKTLARYIPEDMVFYFNPENAEDMAKKTIFLWNHPDIVKRKMENAKKLFPLYTWQSEKSKLIRFYEGIH